MKTALVAGATGAIGKALVYQLIEDPAYFKVITVSRKALPIKHHKLEQVVVDYERLENASEKLAADEVFCCLGTTIKAAGSQDEFYKVDHDYVLKIARLGKKHGARQFIMVSAMGADVNSSIFYNRVKGEAERDVSLLRYETLIVVRPSLLVASRVEFRLGETIAKYVMKATGFLMLGPLKKYKAIPVETVAKAMRYYAAQQWKGEHIILNDKLFGK